MEKTVTSKDSLSASLPELRESPGISWTARSGAGCFTRGPSSFLALPLSCCECATRNRICLLFAVMQPNPAWSDHFSGLSACKLAHHLYEWLQMQDRKRGNLLSNLAEGRWMNWFHYAYVGFLIPFEFLMFKLMRGSINKTIAGCWPMW